MFQTDMPNKSFIEKYGQQLFLLEGETKTPFRGFFQPLRYKNKMYLSAVSTELGYDVLTKFLLICPGDVPLEKVNGTDVFLLFGDRDLCVDHCEKIFFKDEPLYYWAVVHQNKGGAFNEE